jgi:hypothetical protein
VRAIGWALALPAAILAAGMIAGPPLFVLAYQRVRGREAWGPSVVVAAAVGVGLWVLFAIVLDISVPWGLAAPFVES